MRISCKMIMKEQGIMEWIKIWLLVFSINGVIVWGFKNGIVCWSYSFCYNLVHLWI